MRQASNILSYPEEEKKGDAGQPKQMIRSQSIVLHRNWPPVEP